MRKIAPRPPRVEPEEYFSDQVLRNNSGQRFTRNHLEKCVSAQCYVVEQ